VVPVLALPLQDQVDEFGGYIGLAAFFGLAVLTVLYFAQAREVKRLREWAGRSPERALELEERVLVQAEQARKVRAQPAPAVAPVPAVAAVPPPRPRTTVHPAAAAAAAATTVVPAAATAAGAAPAVASPAAGNGEPPTTVTPPPAAAPPNGVPPAAFPAPGPLPAPAAPPWAVAPPAARRPAALPAYGAATASRRPAGRGGGRSTATLAVIAGGVAVALAGLVFLGTQVLGGGDGPAPPANRVDAAPTPAQGAAAGAGAQDVEAARAENVVAVLNGTTVGGLAASVAERLQSEGYPQGGKVETGPDQTRTSTVVYYAEGKRAQARDVSKLLDGADVSPMDPDSQALAGANAKLLVIVGSDKAP